MKITIHRALAELKLLTSRIEKAITDLRPVGLHIKGGKINMVHTEEEFKAFSKSTIDSVESLIDRRTKIKSAIVLSNATTKVTVGNKEMSVSDAITEKSFLTEKEKYITALKHHLTSATSKMNMENGRVEENLQKVIEASFGRDANKTRPDDVKNMSDTFRDTNNVRLFDPNELDKKIKALETEVSSFKAEIDAVLSESNAINFIDVE